MDLPKSSKLRTQNSKLPCRPGLYRWPRIGAPARGGRNSGGRIRTSDLRVMGPTSCHLLYAAFNLRLTIDDSSAFPVADEIAVAGPRLPRRPCRMAASPSGGPSSGSRMKKSRPAGMLQEQTVHRAFFGGAQKRAERCGRPAAWLGAKPPARLRRRIPSGGGIRRGSRR